MDVVWAPSADRDLGRLYEYLKLDSPRRAARMVARVVRAAEMLELQPEIGPVVEDLDPTAQCRHLVVAPLRLIYRVEATRILILRIWDSRRDPKTLYVPGGPDSAGDE